MQYSSLRNLMIKNAPDTCQMGNSTLIQVILRTVPFSSMKFQLELLMKHFSRTMASLGFIKTIVLTIYHVKMTSLTANSSLKMTRVFIYATQLST